jgi:hypothetical protein
VCDSKHVRISAAQLQPSTPRNNRLYDAVGLLFYTVAGKAKDSKQHGSKSSGMAGDTQLQVARILPKQDHRSAVNQKPGIPAATAQSLLDCRVHARTQTTICPPSMPEPDRTAHA